MLRNIDKDLRKKLLYDILVICLFIIGSFIPMYGINKTNLEEWLKTSVSNGFNIWNFLAGNSFKSMSIFALGVAPYVTASIITQLSTVLIPQLEELRKQSQEKIEHWTYCLSFVIAIVESGCAVIYFKSNDLLQKNDNIHFCLAMISLMIGSLIIITLSKTIDNRGIGKGISIIMLVNILSQIPSSFISLRNSFITENQTAILFWLICFVIMSSILIGVIFLQNAEKRIKIQHAGQTRNIENINYIPIKLNLGNVMPVVFTTSIFQTILLLSKLIKNDIFYEIAKYFNMECWFNIEMPIYNLGIIVYIFCIIWFSYFYTTFSFDTEDIATRLKKQNIVIVNIRPGQISIDYLNNQLKYLVLTGAICLTILILAPTAIISVLKVPNFALVGTSIFIINSVIIDLYKDIETEIITKREVNLFE